MCIPHGVVGTKDNAYAKEEKPKKHIIKVSQQEFEKGDPNFIDERVVTYKPKTNISFFESLFKS